MSDLLALYHRYCDYSETFSGRSPYTLKGQLCVFKQFVRRTDISELYQMTRPLIENYILDSKINKNWSPNTIRNTLTTIKSFLEWCKNQGFLSTNPAKEIPTPKAPKQLPHSLSKEEAMRLLEWLKITKFHYAFERSRGLAMIGIFLYTGIRRKELLNLKVSQVDFNKHTLFVDSGKGDKDRIIPLNHRLIGFLKAYLKEREKLGKTTPYFFANLRHNKRMSNQAIRRLFERLKKESGVYAYPHLLRHTFATLMLEGGCEIYALSKMLGHSDIKTTTIYLSVSMRHSREQIHKHPLSY